MKTPIGQSLNTSPARRNLAAITGIATVVADMALVQTHSWHSRGVGALLAVAILTQLAAGDCDSLGFTTTSRQGWRWWFRTAAYLGLTIAIILGLGAAISAFVGIPLPIVRTPLDHAAQRFWQMCVYSPILEEFVYRFAICVATVSLVKPMGSIFISGLAFAFLHILYGNSSIENALGGFVLAWVYLKSGSIYVPIVLHSIGNFFALIGQLIAWYALPTN